MVLACIHKHSTGASIPKHGSGYNEVVINKYGKYQDLFSDSFNSLLLKKMKSLESQAIEELGDAQKKLLRVKVLIKKIHEFRKKCPKEKLCFPYRETELSYSGNDLPTFESKKLMFQYLKLTGYGDEMLTKLESLDIGNVVDYDFDLEYAKNSQYLHGFSLYMQKNLKKSKSAESFYQSMLDEMQAHYDEKNITAVRKHNFGEIRKKALKGTCDHVFFDNQIYEKLRGCSENDAGSLYDLVLKEFPDCLTRNGYDEGLRKEHIMSLANSRINKSFPFN
jgi:hypothetical protein